MQNVNKNNYLFKPKETTVNTPIGLCLFLYDLLKDKFEQSTILDICCNTGRLSYFFANDRREIIGVDNKPYDTIKDNEYFKITRYIENDFFSLSTPCTNERNLLVVINPPWNNPDRLFGKALLPEIFVKRIFKQHGVTVPLVLLVPYGFRMNQEMHSQRFRYLRDCGAKITSIISVPRNMFIGVNLQNEVILFNIEGLEPHYFLPDKYIIQ